MFSKVCLYADHHNFSFHPTSVFHQSDIISQKTLEKLFLNFLWKGCMSRFCELHTYLTCSYSQTYFIRSACQVCLNFEQSLNTLSSNTVFHKFLRNLKYDKIKSCGDQCSLENIESKKNTCDFFQLCSSEVVIQSFKFYVQPLLLLCGRLPSSPW